MGSHLVGYGAYVVGLCNHIIIGLEHQFCILAVLEVLNFTTIHCTNTSTVDKTPPGAKADLIMSFKLQCS